MKFVATLHSLCCDKGVLTVRWLLLSFALVIGSAQSQEPAPSSTKAGEPKQTQSTQPAQEHRNQTTEKCCEESPWKGIFEGMTGIATAILAITTIVIAVFTIYLYQIGKDTARKELRAYIALEQIYFIDPVNPLAPRIKVKNYGQTPAYAMEIWTGIPPRPMGVLPEGFDYPYNTLNTDKPLVSAQMLHPEQSFERGAAFSRPFIPTEQFHIYGRVTYRDIYNRWWATRFCYLHERNGQFAPNGEYNGEDGPYKERPV
jgi:hypothetical protein